MNPVPISFMANDVVNVLQGSILELLSFLSPHHAKTVKTRGDNQDVQSLEGVTTQNLIDLLHTRRNIVFKF